MPSSEPRPEKKGLDADDRLKARARELVAGSLLRCADAGWLCLDEDKSAVARYHDLHDAAAVIVRRIDEAGLLTRAEEG